MILYEITTDKLTIEQLDMPVIYSVLWLYPLSIIFGFHGYYNTHEWCKVYQTQFAMKF
jgi:hypothetical protein